MANSEVEITKDLSDALAWVLGAVPSDVDAVVVVAACLDKLAKDFGLSESGALDRDPLEVTDLPEPAETLLWQLFGGPAGSLTADHLRDGLYGALVQLVDDRDARKALNANKPLTDLGLLHLGQIYWNLEARGARTRLPIQPGPINVGSRPGAAPIHADIPVPKANGDFATMMWATRANQKGPYKSSGQGFRNQGARLAVLVAQRLVAAVSGPLPDLEGAVLHHAPDDPSRVTAITWPVEEPTPAFPASAPRHDSAHVEEAPPPATSPGSVADQPVDLSSQRVLVGSPASVGSDYQRRGFDAEIEKLWSDGGDRRIWLRGGPGLGKSYAGRRVMEQALSDQGPVREVLLIWVDSADPDSVSAAFAEAIDGLGQLGVIGRMASTAPDTHRAQVLLRLLATSAWRWLIVLDNADARALLDAGLVPTGANPNGRVLATTTDTLDPRIASQGRAIRAGLFTADEAEAYLRGPLPEASRSDIGALAAAVGHHPLALSIAASTISANAMTVTDWIHEFTATDQMDAAADEPDRGGYPYLIGATWKVALDRASRGLPQGTAERAALVAAVQDPDGHPTWLWDSPAVADWVGGQAPLARRHGTPMVVQRLIDHGILELRGGTWKDGQVSIHQLAARAIRESADSATLSEVAGILTEQWLLAITAKPEATEPQVLHRNLRPITALPDLSEPTRTMATALLAYQQPSPATGFDHTWARFLEPYLPVGGATVRIELAAALVKLGDKEAALGPTDRAHAVYREAADLYRQLVDDASLTDDERASCLESLGSLDEHLGDPESAHAHRQQAARLLERLTDPAAGTDSDIDTRISRMADLITLYHHLGDPEGRARAEARALELLTEAPADLLRDASDAELRVQGGTWRHLGRLMVRAGHIEAAKDCLTRAAATYERFTKPGLVDGLWERAVLALGILHAGTDDWVDAEAHLSRIADPRKNPWPDSLGGSEVDDEGGWAFLTDERRDALVLLASVQAHLGRRDDVDRHLTRAATRHRERPTDGDGELSEPPGEGEREWYEDWMKSRADRDREVVRFLLQRAALRACLSDRWGEARGLFGAALESAQEAAADAPGDTTAEAELGRLMAELAWASKRLGLYEEAESHYRRAASIYQTLTELDTTDETAHARLAGMFRDQAECLFLVGRTTEAAEVEARAVSAYRRAAELSPDNLITAKNLAESLTQLAWAAVREGDQTAAMAHREEAITLLSTLADQDPDDHHTQMALAEALKFQGWSWFTSGDREAAVRQWRQAVTVLATLAGDDEALSERAFTQNLMAMALDDHPEDALTHATESSTTFRILAARAPDNLEIQKNLALSLGLLGSVLANVGQKGQAVDHLTSATNILQLLADLNPEERPGELISVLNGLQEVLRDLGRTDEADEALARATALQNRYPEEDENE